MLPETKIRKGTFIYVEMELSNYHETRREIVRLKSEILHATPDPGDQTIVKGKNSVRQPGDPTGRTATLMLSHRKLEQMERVVEAIEFIVEGLPDEKKELIRLRYWTRPQTLTWEGIAQRLKYNRATVIRWRDDIVMSIADRIGLR